MVTRTGSTSPVCAMCRTRPPGADAHILPRALFRDIDDGSGPLFAIPADPAQRERRSRTGFHDREILCHECENRFKIYDDHGVKALRRVPVPNRRWGSRDVEELPGVDAAKMKLFFMHVLWRADASSQLGLRAISLGPRTEVLRALLLADDPGSIVDFPVVMSRYRPDPDDLHRVIPSPRNGRWKNGARLIQFSIATWNVLVTTSAQGVPKEILPVVVQPGDPVPVVTGSELFRDSRQLRELARIVQGRSRSD